MFSFLFTVSIIVKSTESVEISASSFSTWDKPLKHFCFLGNTSEFYILQSFFFLSLPAVVGNGVAFENESYVFSSVLVSLKAARRPQLLLSAAESLKLFYN